MSSTIHVNPKKGGIKKKMKKFRRSKKALSPVVASIILIAVTVAVSIAVAAWMGMLSVGFMATEQLTITNVVFDDTSSYTWVALTVNNTATTSIVLNDFFVNNVKQTSFATGQSLPYSLAANTGYVINATVASPVLASGNNYALKVVSAKGNPFSVTAIMP
jgi:flagellin-like protein